MLSSGVSPFSFVFFWPHRPEKFRAEPLQTSVNNRVSNFSMHENGKSRLQSKIFVSQYAKNSWERLLRFKMFRISETFLHITVSLPFSLSHSIEKLRQEPSNVSDNFKSQVSKKKFIKNGISRFSVENFLAQSAERFRCGTLRYIRKVRLAKNFMPNRMISLFSVEFLSRLLPIKLAGDPSVIQDLWETEYFYAQYGGIAILR